MIQFNLLPDVKLAYVKAQRTKRLVMGTAFIATASAFAIFMLLFLGVNVVQKVRLSQLSNQIKDKTSQLKENEDLDKVLTIQNQLGSLDDLHGNKVVATRVLAYIQQLTPNGVTITNFATDFTLESMIITGESKALDRVNTFIDTLKFATYSPSTLTDKDGETEEAGKKAFSEIVLTQFGRTETTTSYTINLKFDPALFGNDVTNLLTIPNQPTTNSAVDQPGATFQKPTTQVTDKVIELEAN